MDAYWSEIITFLVTAGSSWGMITTKIKNQEKEIEELKGQIDEMRKDHDLVIRIDTKVDSLADMMKEMKQIIETKRSKK
jgi:flagellar capping protein FliD